MRNHLLAQPARFLCLATAASGLLSAVACSSSGVQDINCNPSQGPVGPDCNVMQPNPEDASPVWGDRSQGLEIQWFSFWEGAFGVELKREDMMEAQLSLLASLRLADPEPGCAADVREAALTVVDADDGERTYFAVEGDWLCGSDEPFVRYEEWGAFIETLGCLPSKTYEGRDLSSAPSIAAGSGCEHGLFNYFDEERSYWFRLDVEHAEQPYRIRTLDCRDRGLALTVLDDGANEVLAELAGEGVAGEPEALDQCPELVYEFETAGSYVLRVDLTPREYAGDFYLSVEPVKAARVSDSPDATPGAARPTHAKLPPPSGRKYSS